MAKYTEAELQIVAFEAEDVITTSNPVYDDEGNQEL
jgi:hypothetical protein